MVNGHFNESRRFTRSKNSRREYKNICESSMSDHRMVICQIKLNNKPIKINRNILWKLNESVLEHQHVNEGIIKFCETIPSLIESNIIIKKWML